MPPLLWGFLNAAWLDTERNEMNGEFICGWCYFMDFPNDEMKSVLKAILEEEKK